MKQKLKNKNFWNVERVSLLFFSLCFFMLIFGLARLSIPEEVNGLNLKQMASNRRTRRVNIPANRGTIYDNSGNVLANNVSSYTVLAYLDESRAGSSRRLAHVDDPIMTANALSPLLGMTEDDLIRLLSQDLYQVELGPGGRNINETLKRKIESLNLPGISFIESQRRYYPNGDFASYVTGYATKRDVEVDGVVSRQIVGELGIEAMFDSILRGEEGYTEYQVSRQGFRIPGTTAIHNPPVDGSNIHLTIDATIQRFIEDEVKKSNDQYAPEWLMIVAMDAKTGEILGSATTPSYNPNVLNITNYENPLTSFVFEPGSTMKTYTYACAMEKGTYDGSATFESEYLQLTQHRIRNWHRPGWGEIDFDLGYEYSSNVAIGYMMRDKLDGGDLIDCLDDYGFGRLSGISLPRERSGRIRFRYDSEVAAAGYGQGITTTAVQHLQAMTMFANNGELIKPRIIQKIVNSENEATYISERVSKGQVISTDTVDNMKILMHNVVHENNEGTTGRGYFVEGLDVIGKTATAQIYDYQTGRYSSGPNNMIYSFSGMFPYDDPSIIIYSAAKRPKFGGNSVIVNPTNNVIRSIAKYLNINQELNQKPVLSEIVLSSYINKNPSVVERNLKTKGLNPIIIGDGNKIIKQSRDVNSILLTNDKLFLITNFTEFKLPSLIGYSSKEARELLDIVSIEYELEGYGFVSDYVIDEKGVYHLKLSYIKNEQ